MTQMTRDPFTDRKINEISKVRDTGTIDAETENVPYLSKGMTGELQTWYRDGVR